MKKVFVICVMILIAAVSSYGRGILFFDDFGGTAIDTQKWTVETTSTATAVDEGSWVRLMCPGEAPAKHAYLTTVESFSIEADPNVTCTVLFDKWQPGSSGWETRGFVSILDGATGQPHVVLFCPYFKRNDGSAAVYYHTRNNGELDAFPGTAMVGIATQTYITFILHMDRTHTHIYALNYLGMQIMDEITVTYDPIESIQVRFGAGSNGFYPWTALNVAKLQVMDNAPETCAEVWDIGEGMAADFDKDCDVDMQDLALLMNAWLTTNNP